MNRLELITALTICLPIARRGDDTRPHMAGIHFDADGVIVATDGHTLAAVTVECPEGWLPYAAAKELLAVAKAKKGAETIEVPLGQNREFPSWRRVIPDKGGTLEEPIGVSAEYLLDAARACAVAQKRDGGALSVRFTGLLGPIVFEVGSLRYVVMPRNLKDTP